jgi:hypothetical protein
VGYSLRGAQNVLPQVASGAESASPRRFALAPAGRCQQLHRVIKQRVVVIVGDAEASAPGVPQVVVPGALVPVEPERPVVGMPRRRRHRKRKRANLPIHVIREAAGRASTSAPKARSHAGHQYCRTRGSRGTLRLPLVKPYGCMVPVQSHFGHVTAGFSLLRAANAALPCFTETRLIRASLSRRRPTIRATSVGRPSRFRLWAALVPKHREASVRRHSVDPA